MQRIDDEIGDSPASTLSQATLWVAGSSKDSANSPRENTSPPPARRSSATSQATLGGADSKASTNSPQDDTQPPPVSGSSPTSITHFRSCIICRKRKVRCDKKLPCSSCIKSGSQCIYPGPGRAPRRIKKPPEADLLGRLTRLEGVIGLHMGGNAGIAQPQPDAAATKPAAHENEKILLKSLTTDMCLGLNTTSDEQPDSGLVKEFGRLSVEGGKSQYVSNKFWVGLSEDVAEMRDMIPHDSSTDEESYPSPGVGSAASANHQAFVFGFSSTMLSLRQFHPPTEQIVTYWQIFKENVDPLIKIFHGPSTERFLIAASEDLSKISKPNEVMMFSIYFAVITSMSDMDCSNFLGVDKHSTMKNYRFAFEQAMARAGFLSTQELVILQAFTLFLTCVRRFDDSRYVWTLTGLVIRLAQSLGIHRDGKQFGLSPFETEMRRRLWWQICAIDVRASEDHGSDFSIVEQSFDTRLPLNVNDIDIFPEMTETPAEREGKTEMLFDLIRYSVSTTVRRLSYAPPGPGPCRTKNAMITLEDKERLIEELHQYLEMKYLRYCDMSEPLDWVAGTVSRLILAKMWLIVHHPFQRKDGGAGLPQEIKDRLFHTSIEVIEFSHLLETESTTRKWHWLFRTYVPWHAIAFVLSQLCVHTSGPGVNRAWAAMESVFEDWGGTGSESKRGMLWKPLRKLMARARGVRAREMKKQVKFPLDGSLGMNMLLMIQNPDPNADPNMLIPTHTTGYQPYPYIPTTTATSSYIPYNTIAGNQDFQQQRQQPAPATVPLSIINDHSMGLPTEPMNPAEGLYSPPDLLTATSNEVMAVEPEGVSWPEWASWIKDQGVEMEKGAEGIMNWF